MRRVMVFAISLAFAGAAVPTAKADPIMGTITLTVEPALPYASVGPGIPNAAVYTSGPVNLSDLPQNFSLTGPPLGFVGGLIQESIRTTFNMEIAFNGTGGSQPYVDVVGSLSGGVLSNPDGAGSNFSGTPTSATLHDWTASSGVPLTLIGQSLNLSNYQFVSQGFSGTAPPPQGRSGWGWRRHRRSPRPSQRRC